MKLLDQSTQATVKVKGKSQREVAILDITNNCPYTVIFKHEKHLSDVDLRSIGYYKIKHGVLQQIWNIYYRFELADKLCEDFNTSTYNLKKEMQKSDYP